MATMNPPANAAMNIQVSGRRLDVGDALRTRIGDALEGGVGKYFGRGGSAEVRLHKDGHQICCDMVVVLATGQQLVVRATGGDAHAAFDAALAKLETRVRRYKRALTNHHPHNGGPRGPAETAPLVVLRGADEDDDADDDWGADGSAGDGPPAAMIVAETTAPLKTLTVAMAVMELDLTDAPVVMFRNMGHGGLSVVYRRPDGNVGWIDPERTPGGSAKAAASPASSKPAAASRTGARA